MRQTVNSFIKKHQLLHENATVVVGVSGGPDSLALLHFLLQESSRLNLKIIVAHVDHMLRGKESEADFQFVEDYCKQKNICFEGKKIDVATYRNNHQLTLQVAARECRYRFFQEIMKKHRATLLALAHHGDDQIETILMRQIRGAYGFGLAGIPVKRIIPEGAIIRPFLCLSKEEITQYCHDEKINPRIDQSNFTSKYVRNRIRKDILPILKKENRVVHQRYQQQSELMYEDEAFLQTLAKRELEDYLLLKSDDTCILSVSSFNRIPFSLQRRGFQLILNYLYSRNMPQISTVHIDEFLQLMKTSQPSGYLHFPNGLTIKKSYDECILTFDRENDSAEFFIQLSIPGIVTFKKGKITGEVLSKIPDRINNEIALFDFEKLVLPLKVRNRYKGDRITLKGGVGSKKLKDLFIDKKVPRDQRDLWPVVVDGNDTIVWVPKLKKSNIAIPSTETTKFLTLFFEEIES